jgi:hypothetical protein
MSFDPHSRRFDLRQLFPATETDGRATSEATDASPFSSDDGLTSDPAGRDFDEALEHISSEEWCVCPLCGAIVARDGTVLG